MIQRSCLYVWHMGLSVRLRVHQAMPYAYAIAQADSYGYYFPRTTILLTSVNLFAVSWQNWRNASLIPRNIRRKCSALAEVSSFPICNARLNTAKLHTKILRFWSLSQRGS
jgi:hypothetical protein